MTATLMTATVATSEADVGCLRIHHGVGGARGWDGAHATVGRPGPSETARYTDFRNLMRSGCAARNVSARR